MTKRKPPGDFKRARKRYEPREPREHKDRLLAPGGRHKKIGAGEVQAYRRYPLAMEYWIATPRGQIPVGPYYNPTDALAHGHTLGLKRLWWVEAEAVGDL